MSVSDLVAVATVTCLDRSGGCGTWPNSLCRFIPLCTRAEPQRTTNNPSAQDQLPGLGSVDAVAVGGGGQDQLGGDGGLAVLAEVEPLDLLVLGHAQGDDQVGDLVEYPG